MARVKKVNSDITGLSYALEESLGVLPAAPVWVSLEPNGYSDFGGEITLLARNPINPSRQRKKGVVTDKNASAGWGTDLTQENFQDLVQGFMFADSRTKDQIAISSTDAAGYEPLLANSGDGYAEGDLLYAKNFSDDAANGLKIVEGTPVAGEVPISTPLPDLLGESGTITRVGYKFDAGDASIDVTGTRPALVTILKDLTTLGLTIGEFVFIGGDGSGESFDSDANNNFARVRKIEASRIEFDKTGATFVNDSGAANSIALFFGNVCKNETGSLIKRRSYNLERQLGFSDDSKPAEIQSEYVEGAVPSELSLNIPSADKVQMDITFQGTNATVRDGVVGVKSGSRPRRIESSAFNTSDNVPRVHLAVVDPANASPEPLFAFAQDITITINNNVTTDKAIGVLGAFEVTAGTFEVGGDMTAYFSDVAAIQSVTNNADITLDLHMVKENQGVSLDMPLISLGDGRPNVEKDQAITLPLGVEAATGAKIDVNLDHTLLWTFWDYLPDLAS